jgi:uncharacterized protein (DUF302 family)
MTANPENGVISILSRHSVDETVARVKKTLEAKGVKLFALVDHSGEAAMAGLEMRPTKLLIFGNPIVGTPLMLAAPSIAIDLPLKLLIAEDAGGKVWISYNAPAYIQARHHLPPELFQAYSHAGWMCWRRKRRSECDLEEFDTLYRGCRRRRSGMLFRRNAGARRRAASP